ncbi:MAG: hypothetical protein WKF75_00695 [Singulisphaera sp.]
MRRQLLGSCLLACPATAQEAKKDQKGLELGIRADKDRFLLGEPVVLYVTLRNVGQAPTQVARLLDPEYDFVKYQVKEPDGDLVPFVPWAIKDHPAPQERLAPGESVQDVAKIFYGGQGWTFQQPGKYEITATYQSNVRSNSLAITVVEPEDRAARRAADLFLGSDEAGRFLLLEGGDHLSGGMRHLKQVVEEFPETPHANYANYALGSNLLVDFANFKENKPAKRSRPASDYLEKARAKPAGLFIRRERMPCSSTPTPRRASGTRPRPHAGT